jgi:hypothetical protein
LPAIITGQPITTAGTVVSGILQCRLIPPLISFQAALAYGSGGTSINAYVQTSLDGGLTWNDVASFGFTTASARSVMSIINAAALTPVTLTDGALAAGTALNIFGSQWRTKTVSVGTYAGNTSLSVFLVGNGFTPLP